MQQDILFVIQASVGFMIAVVFILPYYVNFLTGAGILISIFAYYFLQGKIEYSMPNEWMLVIENGKLVKAGIGLISLILPTQTIVKFPSKIQSVTFSANNVTKEVQGVELSGIAIWSVNREGDGPFKCYKYMQGGDPSDNVKLMCESIIRHQIANHTMKDLLTNRQQLRESIQKDLQQQFTGWGIWLETIEITDVRICSNQLFEDLQAEFRQEVHLKAEEIRMQTNQKINEIKMQSDAKMNKSKADMETKRDKFEKEQLVKRDNDNANFQKMKFELEMDKLEIEKEMEKMRYDKVYKLNTDGVAKNQTLEKMKIEYDQKNELLQFEIDNMHTPLTLQKYLVDSAERIFRRGTIKDVSVNQYIGPENTGIASILPQQAMMMQLLKTDNKQQ